MLGQRLQTLKKIITSNQSSTTTLMETSNDLIYITFVRVWMVKILLEILTRCVLISFELEPIFREPKYI